MIPRPRLEKAAKRVEEIESLLAQPGIAANPAETQVLAKELAEISRLARPFRSFLKIEKEITELETLLRDPSQEAELKHLYEEEKAELLKQKEKVETEIEDELLRGSDPDAGRNAIVEIRAGTGGDEAALFASDLFRMFSRYAQNLGLKVELMDSNPTGKGGFKEIIFEINGKDAFRRFRYESGIHRVQRVPATEASGRIHTSAVTVAVLPEAEEVDVEINPTDLRVDTFRSSGPGGQHVNKTDSAVRLTHLPSGLVVSCQDEKSQHKNRTKAMRILRTRLLDMKRSAQQKEIQKTRRMHIGSGDRSGKIRTYNFHDQRVTDHRIGLTLHNLDDILNGRLDELYQALDKEEKARRLAGEAE
jgi:peptide chain release factor 1